MNNSKLITRAELSNPNRLTGRIILVGSLPNDAYIVGVPKIINTFSDDRPNVGSGGTSIITVSFPAHSLKGAGDLIEYIAEFAFVSNGNSKLVQYSFGGQTLSSADWSNTTSTVTQVLVTGRLYRLTSTTFRGYVTVSLPTTGGSLCFTSTADRTVSDMDSNSLDFVVAIQGGASNEIFHKSSQLSLTRMS